MTRWKITWREEGSDQWGHSTITNNWPEILPEDGEAIAAELVQKAVDEDSEWADFRGCIEISEPSQISGIYEIIIETQFVVTAYERERA